MSEKQELAFGIAQELLDEHNQKLKELGDEFFGEFDKVFRILSKEGYKATDFESLMYDYLGVLKREYYKAGANIERFVQRSEEKEVAEKVARIERKNIV